MVYVTTTLNKKRNIPYNIFTQLWNAMSAKGHEKTNLQENLQEKGWRPEMI